MAHPHAIRSAPAGRRRIAVSTPMTTDERWPPARLRLCPATHPRTNGTAPSRPHSTPSSRNTSRGFSNGSTPKESHSPTSSSKSSRRTSNAGASNTDSCASNAMPAGMRSWWRSVASAGGLSPSCGARRMAETAAHLVEHVLPEQPIRQWVLSFPYPLRFLFATRPAVLTRVLGIVYRAISTFLVRHAGLRSGTGARTGAVTLVQRFGSALNPTPISTCSFLTAPTRSMTKRPGSTASPHRAPSRTPAPAPHHRHPRPPRPGEAGTAEPR